MNEFKKFVKNENDNWEEYKDLINEDTKFMMFDGENAKELSVSEMIHQLILDNKYLELQIINLQSKIDKAIEYYETHQQECIIGRNKDDKLIKNYYLPAQCSKKLYEFLKEDK